MKTNLYLAGLGGLLALMLPVVVHAQFTYTTNDNAITITGYTGSGGAVAIPDTLDGWPVVSIGNSAFNRCTNITRVTIPDSVTNIAARAFNACTRMTNFTIGAGVVAIGEGAFFAWHGTDVTVPAGVGYIGQRAFAGPNLQAITVDPLNPAYSSVAGVLFSRNPAGLVEYPVTRAGSYTIPNGVSNIWTYSFYACSKLTSITIPAGVTYIGSDVFQYCTNLMSAYFEGTMPFVASHGPLVFEHADYVTLYVPALSSDWYAFNRPVVQWLPPQAQFTYITNSRALTITGFTGSNSTVTIPESIDGWPVVSIGDHAFNGRRVITNLTIANSITNIAAWAFNYCTNLSSCTIGEHVLAIGEGAFWGWHGTAITVPASVGYIGPRAFFGPSLLAITVDPLNPAYYSADGVLFSRSPSGLREYPTARAGSYRIPSGVSNIWSYAFYACSNLTTVTIPASVISIGTASFQYCVNLMAACFEGDAPYVGGHGSTVFDHDDHLMIYILPGSGGWAYPPNFFRPLWPWLPQMEVARDPAGVRTNQFGFNITWADGKVVVVEACTGLANPVWTSVGTNTLTGGSAYFSDPASTNYPARFYRVLSQ